MVNWLKVAVIASLVAPESRQMRPPTPPPPPRDNRRASTIPYDDLPTPPPEDAHGREKTADLLEHRTDVPRDL